MAVLAERRWSFRLRLFSVFNLVIAVTIAVIQIVISTTRDDNYARVGAGIWAGALLGITAVTHWITSSDGSRKMFLFAVTLTLTILSTMASLAVIGISSTVIHQTSRTQVPEVRLEPATPDGSVSTSLYNAVRGLLQDHGTKLIQRFHQKVCNYAYNEDCGVRTALESVLAACGVVTFGVNLSAAVVLVSLWSGNVMS